MPKLKYRVLTDEECGREIDEICLTYDLGEDFHIHHHWTVRLIKLMTRTKFVPGPNMIVINGSVDVRKPIDVVSKCSLKASFFVALNEHLQELASKGEFELKFDGLPVETVVDGDRPIAYVEKKFEVEDSASKELVSWGSW